MAYEKKLIEGCFPCQQVGAETKRERGSSSSLPPLYFLHVWWARRPLTPSRAAILSSILPANTDPNVFLQELGIVKKQAVISNQYWTLVGKNLELVEPGDNGEEYIHISSAFDKALDKENLRRAKMLEKLNKLLSANPQLSDNAVFTDWFNDNAAITVDLLFNNVSYSVKTIAASPAAVNERITFASSDFVRNTLGNEIRLDDEDRYGYNRAYESKTAQISNSDICVLDPTAGGGSIPFEALRLGCNVISNDLNPVATVIQLATLKYPAEYGKSLLSELQFYGDKLVETVREKLHNYFKDPVNSVNDGYIYCRIVICPHCGAKAPLLNSFLLAKSGDGWAVKLETYEEFGEKKVKFIPYCLVKGKGLNGESPELGTVENGVGICIHCGQAISSDEIKAQARGESEYGTWYDQLYCVAAIRYQPKLDKNGQLMVYASGPDKGKERTEKVKFFRAPTQEDFNALKSAERELEANWDRWEAMDLIPTEKIPKGHKTTEPLRVGIERWSDMFTHRQLLGHLTAMETLQNIIPGILAQQGEEKGKAIVTYLQFMVDKLLDYNSRQTLWNTPRGTISHTFTRHDFSHKWTFGEMVLTGERTGIEWAKNQILVSYKGICELLPNKVTIPSVINGSAANMQLGNESADVICMDPPYYNNVQYAELSDYFYVWQKRTFRNLYPDMFNRRFTNKIDEAVANPARDGSAKDSEKAYESRMREIFVECQRVLKDDGVMTLMFTHKTQQAWETLTKALIESGWIITASMPVESEYVNGIHQRELAAAASSIFWPAVSGI